jgi:hypothetical protein
MRTVIMDPEWDRKWQRMGLNGRSISSRGKEVQNVMNLALSVQITVNRNGNIAAKYTKGTNTNPAW